MLLSLLYNISVRTILCNDNLSGDQCSRYIEYLLYSYLEGTNCKKPVDEGPHLVDLMSLGRRTTSRGPFETHVIETNIPIRKGPRSYKPSVLYKVKLAAAGKTAADGKFP